MPALVLFAAGVSHALALFGLTVFVGVGNGLTLANAYGCALSIALGAALNGLTALAVECAAMSAVLTARV